jgi:hypothetical protein
MRSAKDIINSIVAGNLALNIIMSTSLQLLWGMINTFQIIVLVPLFDLSFPLTSMLFFQVVTQITRFNIIPAEDIIRKYL